MLNRRGFALAGLALLVSRAVAGKGTPELWSGEILEKAAKGSVVIADRHVRLRSRARPTELVMLSTSNDNQALMLWVVMPLQPEDHYQYLRLGSDWWASNGTGRDAKQTTTSFQLDRASARRIAKAFGIRVHERTKLDGGLRYTFRIPPKATTSTQTAIPIVLRVDNAGTTTVGLSVGGRQRGPRDNRFSFVITRNGKPVAIKDAPDLGGLMFYKEIKPGAHAEVTCPDLRAWADLALPGFYAVEARYDGELVKDGKMPNTAAERASVWDIAATGQGSILVQ